MKICGDSEEEAGKNIRHSDEARASYYHHISNLTWGDRQNYDLLIDSSIGIEASADTICHYLQFRKR